MRGSQGSVRGPNPALHLTRPRPLFPVAGRVSVKHMGIAAGQVSFIVRCQMRTITLAITSMLFLSVYPLTVYAQKRQGGSNDRQSTYWHRGE